MPILDKTALDAGDGWATATVALLDEFTPDLPAGVVNWRVLDRHEDGAVTVAYIPEVDEAQVAAHVPGAVVANEKPEPEPLDTEPSGEDKSGSVVAVVDDQAD